jgi:hypothetical protein
MKKRIKMKKKLFYLLALSYFATNSFAACNTPIDFGNKLLTNMNLGGDLDANSFKIQNLVMTDSNGTVSEATNQDYVDATIARASGGYISEVSARQGGVSLKAAAEACYDMLPVGTWRLPQVGELVNICAQNDDMNVTLCDPGDQNLWTATTSTLISPSGNKNAWLVFLPDTFRFTYNSLSTNVMYRCVR